MKELNNAKRNSLSAKIIQIDTKNQSNFDAYSEQKIWDSFRNGDQSALIYIYNQFFSELLRYGLQFTKDRETVKDCIQNMFTDLFQSRKNLNSTTSIKFYLFRTLRRRLSKTSKNNWFYAKDITNNPIGFIPEESPEEILINAEKHQQLLKLIKETISTLSSRQREIIYYYYYEGFSYEEIAALMNMSKVKSARTLLYRAIDAIKQHLEKKHGGLSINDLNSILLIFLSDYQLFTNFS